MHEQTDRQTDRQTILDLVGQYCDRYCGAAPWQPGERVPYAGRVYNRSEMMNLVDSALDFWLTAGRYVDAFERGLGEFIGVRYVSMVTSGSAANLVAMAALTAPELGERQVKPGDEVITVAAAFPTTVAPIVQCGAVPVFVDITIPQYNIDVTKLTAALSPRTKAVFIAHTLGNPFDISAVRAFCDEHGLWLIEDNCDALGAEYEAAGVMRRTGAYGDIGTSSFYPAHHITTGEGGAVYTDNPLLHRLIRSYRDWGRDCVCGGGQDNTCGHRFDGQYGTMPQGYDHKYIYSHFGYNLKATEMQAAIGCAQLAKLPDFIDSRRRHWLALHNALEPLADRIILPEAAPHSSPSPFGFIMTLREPGRRDAVVRAIESKGVQTRMLFGGNITRQPMFATMQEGSDYRVVGTLEQTDRVMNDSFWVGVYPGLSDEQLEYMIQTLTDSIQSAAEGF